MSQTKKKKSKSPRPNHANFRSAVTSAPETVALSGRLEEFRTALEEEIKSAKVEAFGSAVALVAGRQISHVGKSFQYVFRLKDALRIPDDAPGELRIQSRPPTDVTVIAVDGMTIILNSESDLGEYVAEARLSSDLTFLLKKLIARIEELSGSINDVGDRILNNTYAELEPVRIGDSGLNERQHNALQSSLGRNLTFIWGPPGTGKTKTIGQIGHYLRLGHRSVLIVSHTNAAVDQALMHIAEAADPDTLDHGRILRVGNPRDSRIPNKFPGVLLETQVERRSRELSDRLKSLHTDLDHSTANIRKLTSDIELHDWFRIAKHDLAEMTARLNYLREMDASLDSARARYATLRKETEYWDKAKRAALKAQANLIRLRDIETRVLAATALLAQLSSDKAQLLQTLQEAQAVLHETESVNWIIRTWRGLPSVDNQIERVEGIQSQTDHLSAAVEQRSDEIRSLNAGKEVLSNELSEFGATYPGTPDEIIQKDNKLLEELKLLRDRGISLRNQCNELRSKLTQYFRGKLQILQQLGFANETEASAEELLDLIQDGLGKVESHLAPIDIEASRLQLRKMVEHVSQIKAEIAGIEDSLSRIESLVISEAAVVATTLTRAYTNDSVRARRYDTIIIDEASMAPIPAIWVASSLVDKNAVIVGDYKQLPPIVVSSNEIAKKWLGRDIFVAAGVDKLTANNFVALKEQYRMDPEVASIPIHFFYNEEPWINRFRNQSADFVKWFDPDWGNDSAVILIDTGPLNSWVTSVPRGRGSSRLNFLSATLCIDLCHMMLRTTRPKRAADGEERRIFIECPYQPHAKFLDILLQENNLSEDVEVGTIHTFQGSEAEVVIFDLVNDEPHWRVGLFMQENDENTRRLINVAVTRARRRLLIVGDFSYIERMSKKAFLGCDFIPFLKKRFPLVSALDVTPPGIATRAAKAVNLVSKGEIEADSARMIVTQDDFYALLLADIDSARNRVVIYSPFLTRSRISSVQATLLSARDRGIRVFVVTKPLQERGKRSLQEFRFLEQTLEEWGVTIIHKQGMHEKLVFVDGEILWSGSLNPLSYSDTQEVMERRKSETLVREYGQIIRFKELVGEFSDEPPKCPICESEIVASEGRDDPFYWRCVVDDCYSRSIDQPQIQGGVIACSSCGGKVEFGEWGGKPAWRCADNRHHHQRIIRNHLKLPKMKQKIPAERMSEVETLIGLSHAE